jgi:hypothetical protein
MSLRYFSISFFQNAANCSGVPELTSGIEILQALGDIGLLAGSPARRR